jgi:aspartate aminotransferase-like enzyme
MFGPNVKATLDGRKFHHRGSDYHDLIHNLEQAFQKRWGNRHEYLFLSGSGTLANEAVLFSSEGKYSTLKHPGEFASRLKKLARTHNRLDMTSRSKMWPQYETADALPVEEPPTQEGAHFADCVSAFPYYDPPKSATVWTTVSSKQLGGFPICSVVAVRPGMWEFMRPDCDYSVLNLARYRASQAEGMSPHTPSIPLLQDLLERVEALNLPEFRSFIDERRRIVLDHFGEAAVGEGPVVNVMGVRPATVERLQLYRNVHGQVQLFLYSEPEVDVAKFCKELTV